MKNRTYKFWFLWIIMGAFLIPVFAQNKPNIIVIMADDMGFSDLGCFGGEIPTPNLDKLAQGGVRLNQFYNGARCCPTRASLMTGLYAHQAGVGHMVAAVGTNPSYQGYMNKNSVTFGEAMKANNYFTAMVGKWHVGHKEGQRPSDRGFERSLNAAAGGFYFSADEKANLFLDGKPVKEADGLPENWYTSDLWTQYSLKFIDEAQAANKLFMLYLAENAPHFPLQAPEEDIQKFRGKYKRGWEVLRKERYERQLKMGLIDAKYALTPTNPKIPKWESLSEKEKAQYDDMMAIYAATVSRLDKAIGDLIEGLKKRGVYDNTMIVFLSDNGGNAEPGIAGVYKGEKPGAVNSVVHIGQCWAEVNNTPFWLYKHHTSEGGIASPFIISYPNGLDKKLQGTISNQIGHITDIMPTCIDLAKGTYPSLFEGNKIQPMEGISLLNLLKGKNVTREKPICWEHEGNRAIRDGKWKMVSNLSEPWQLYDMEADRTELHDLSATQPEMVKKLTTSYETWYKRVGAEANYKTVHKWHFNILEAVKK